MKAETNDLLRSAHEIAKRKGKDTNWEPFENNLRNELLRQASIPESTNEQDILRATVTPKTYRLAPGLSSEKKTLIIDRHNFWLMFAMFMFGITKIVALICAAVIAIHGNIWIGAALFIGAIVFRITWTYVPDVENKKVRDEMEKAKNSE